MRVLSYDAAERFLEAAGPLLVDVPYDYIVADAPNDEPSAGW
jgi:hypothetical protein